MDIRKRMTDVHRARLRELEDVNGELTPERVLEDARSENSPLHDLYDWDVDRAAHTAWIIRSRDIIGAFRMTVTISKTVHVLPRYVENPDKVPGAQGYIQLEAIQSDDLLARRVLIAECNRIASAVTRARSIAAFCDMQADFEDLLQRVVGLRERIERGDDDGANIVHAPH